MYLETIVAHKRQEVSRMSGGAAVGKTLEQLASARPVRDFKRAISSDSISMIAEIKFRSPSKGILQQRFTADELAGDYIRGGASAISVLADEKFFGGSAQLVREIAHNPAVTVPVLYKDFVLDSSQVFQARAAGADAVLLIARILKKPVLTSLINLTRSLGMTPLVETFEESDIKLALECGADVIGINNRDLSSFGVNMDNAIRLRSLIPPHVVVVSESGISTREQAVQLEAAGFSSMLIGESLLSADKPGDKVAELVRSPSVSSRGSNGYYGKFGGRYVSETLQGALDDVQAAFESAIKDPTFQAEFLDGCRNFIGRSTPVTPLTHLSERIGGAQIFAKREDLAHTGAHKINNAYGQALLAKRLGKRRIVAETGAGQHGVAVATVCAKLGLQCVVYMGAIDAGRQNLNVLRMRLLGAEVKVVSSGTQTLKDAVNEAIRDWIARPQDTHYLLGSAVGPHPYPMMVRSFQSVIGQEARGQILDLTGRLPSCVVACVGGGSNAIGIFSAFIDNPHVRLVGVQAGGQGLDTGKHSAPLVVGVDGIFQGSRSYLLQDADGQVLDTHSIAAGLDYAAAGPEHSFLRDSGRVHYTTVDDSQALEGLRDLSRYEGIIPALESSHAIAKACMVASELSSKDIVLVNISGRGDKDLPAIEHMF